MLVDGKPFDPNPPTTRTLEIKAFLDKSSKDEVHSLKQMRESGFKVGRLYIFGGEKRFASYCHHHGSRNVLYFGHPRAIETFRKCIAKALAERAQ